LIHASFLGGTKAQKKKLPTKLSSSDFQDLIRNIQMSRHIHLKLLFRLVPRF